MTKTPSLQHRCRLFFESAYEQKKGVKYYYAASYLEYLGTDSLSAEQIYEISKEVEAGAGILFLYGNYTGDIMNFDMAAELLEMDDIETRSIVGADDVNSHDRQVRTGLPLHRW